MTDWADHMLRGRRWADAVLWTLCAAIIALCLAAGTAFAMWLGLQAGQDQALEDAVLIDLASLPATTALAEVPEVPQPEAETTPPDEIEETPIEGFGADAVRILAAIDPANPYGALLPWPNTGGGPPPKRINGAYLILVAGKPVLYLGSAGRQLTHFPTSISEEGGELPLALAAMHRIPQRGRKRLAIQQIDGLPALESPLREALLRAGFEADYDALLPARGYTTRIGRDPNAAACAGPRR